MRLVDQAVTTDELRLVADRAQWTGAIQRPAGWWKLHQLLRAADRATHYVVLHSTDGVDDGYAIYRPENTGEWFTSTEKTVTVTDFVAVSDAARAGLWRHLLTLDMVDVVAFESLALDDPLPLALVDRRGVELGPAHDETWLRLVDVEAALQARSFGDEDPVALQVIDPLLTANNGTYEIGPKAVVRTSAPPDLSVDVSALAAAYLGGTRWQHLAATGRVAVHTPGSVRRLDALFASGAQPFSGTVF